MITDRMSCGFNTSCDFCGSKGESMSEKYTEEFVTAVLDGSVAVDLDKVLAWAASEGAEYNGLKFEQLVVVTGSAKPRNNAGAGPDNYVFPVFYNELDVVFYVTLSDDLTYSTVAAYVNRALAITAALNAHADAQTIIDRHMEGVSNRIIDVFENADEDDTPEDLRPQVFAAAGITMEDD